MSQLLDRLNKSPTLARVVPFAIFVGLTFLQDFTGPTGVYWVYTFKSLVGAWLLWQVKPLIAEMRWKLTWEAMVVGVLVFVMWVGLDSLFIALGLSNSYPKLQLASGGWNPQAFFGLGLAWFFNLVRLAGSTLVVPPLEEVFFRSFLYRYLKQPDFLAIPLSRFMWGPFLGGALFFGLAHREWLAGILCGFAYQGLVCWKNRLEDAITAHAITNFLLGCYVMATGSWHYW